MSRWSRTIGLAAFIGLVATLDVSADASKTRYHLAPDSRLWIEVSSNIKKHSCAADDVTGDALLDTKLIEEDGYFSATADTEEYVTVSTVSTGLDCGNGRLNRDMRRSLKAHVFPVITYALEEAQLIEPEGASHSSSEVRVSGSLTVAGHKRVVHSVVASSRSRPGQHRITGSIPLSMFEFQIDPPTAFFGLVRARDHLTIHFDLVINRTD